MFRVDPFFLRQWVDVLPATAFLSDFVAIGASVSMVICLGTALVATVRTDDEPHVGYSKRTASQAPALMR